MVTFDLDGHTFEVDEGANVYRIGKLLVRSDVDLHGLYDALEELFPGGRDEAYIAELGGPAHAARLCNAAIGAIGDAAKK